MEEKKLVPKRRFVGFDREWELSLVENFGNNYYGGGTPKTTIKEFWNGSIPWIQSSDLEENIVTLENTKNKITELGLQKSAAKLISENSIAIVTRVGVGKIAFIPYKYATSQDFLSISDLNVEFHFGTYALYNLLQNRKYSVQGTSIKGMTKDELLSMKILIPVKPKEQQKIGQFFKVLDERIANQERKIAKVKALKEAYLTEMFPQEGETVPKRRFKGFEGEWLELRLDNTLEINSGIDYKHLSKGDIPVYGTGGYMLSVNDQLSTKDGIGIGRKGTIDKPQFLKAPFWTVDTLFYMLPRMHFDVYFLYFICKTIKWKTYDESTGVPSLSKNTIENITVMVPIEKEQQKIGQFFKNLDDQIATEEAKLEKLKKMKEAYLEEMFV